MRQPHDLVFGYVVELAILHIIGVGALGCEHLGLSARDQTKILTAKSIEIEQIEGEELGFVSVEGDNECTSAATREL